MNLPPFIFRSFPIRIDSESSDTFIKADGEASQRIFQCFSLCLVGKSPFFASRITSYNVCYTKLLRRDDRYVLYWDRLPAGTYEHSYLVRATTLGTFNVPPLKASEMYAPEVFGRNGSESYNFV